MFTQNGESRPYTLLDALFQEKILEAGSIRNYAADLGLNPTTVWRYLSGSQDLFAERDNRARQALVESLCLPLDALKELGTISLNEACLIALEQKEK